MFFKPLKFKNKILLTFLSVFVPLILMGSTLAYLQVKQVLQADIEKELQDTTDHLVNLIRTSASVSIKNRLQAIAEKNLDIAQYYYNKHMSGLLSRAQALKTIEEVFLSQSVGISGYIYCINSNGMVLIHPNDGVKDTDVSGFDFVKNQMEIKDGYLEYDWKNPGEATERAKALHMVYFKPLDLIISVSSYREEFDYLVNIDDFRDSILAYKFGKTGYAYVFNEQGWAIVHPNIQGVNLLDQTMYPNEPLKQILKQKTGKLNYFWKNPNEPEPREKIVYFQHLPEYKWIVASSSYVEEVFAPLKTFQIVLIISLIIVLVLSAGITYLVSGSVTKPLAALMDTLARGIDGDFSVRMDDTGRDEFGRLGRHFNSFMDQLEQYKQAARERKNLAVQLEKLQKMEAIGTLAGGIAHDFNNILSGILGYAQLAELNLESPVKAKGHIAQITKGAHRAARLTQQILTFSRQTEYEKQPLNLYLVVKEALKLMRSSIPTTIEIKENIVSKAKILADPTQMHQVIMNLCTNAYHSMSEIGGTLSVQLEEVEISGDRDVFGNPMDPGKYIELWIMDTGFGMDDETLAKAFDPYFTTKEVGKGTGFGLSLVHAIVEEHGGYIKVNTRVGRGSSFYVYLPLVNQDETPHTVESKETSLRGGIESIMVVDDEKDIRGVVQEFLSGCGYRVRTFEDGAKAFEAFEKDPDQFDLIITDMTMPGMTGAEFSIRVLTLRPGIPIILCTGYSETFSEADALETGIRKYVQKPVETRSLAALIREILD